MIAMMPLAYDPKHVLGWVPQPGIFGFRVLACDETVFKTGSQGIRVHLEVEAGATSPLKFWDNVVFGQRTTWKMHDLCLATGVRFAPPCEASDLVGQSGRAEFDTEEYEGFVRLRVVRYLRADSKAAAASASAPECGD